MAQRTHGRASRRSRSICKYVREFGGIEIDWANGLHAPRYSIETSLDGSALATVCARIDSRQRRPRFASAAGVGGALHPHDDADPGRDVGIAELHVRDLQFGASPNAFIESLAKNGRDAAAIRARTAMNRSYWTIVGVDGDAEESMLSEDGALEARKGSFSIEPFDPHARGLAHVGGRDDRSFARRRLSADPVRRRGGIADVSSRRLPIRAVSAAAP